MNADAAGAARLPRNGVILRYAQDNSSGLTAPPLRSRGRLLEVRRLRQRATESTGTTAGETPAPPVDPSPAEGMVAAGTFSVLSTSNRHRVRWGISDAV